MDSSALLDLLERCFCKLEFLASGRMRSSGIWANLNAEFSSYFEHDYYFRYTTIILVQGLLLDLHYFITRYGHL